MDYYKILQVTPDSSKEVIHMAYKALVKKYHPDISTLDKRDAEEMFKKINEAYEVLSNDQKRRNYDEAREEKVSAKNEYHTERDNNQGNFNDKSGNTYSSKAYSSTKASNVCYRNNKKESIILEKIKDGFEALWSFIKFVLIVLIVISIWNGSLLRIWNQITDKSSHLFQSFENVLSDEFKPNYTEGTPEYTISKYFECLRRGNKEEIYTLIKGTDIQKNTDNYLKVFNEAISAKVDETGYEINTQIYKFTYSLSSVPQADENNAVINAKMQSFNLMPPLLLAIDEYKSKANDEKFIIEQALSGDNQNEDEIFEEIFVDKINKNTQKINRTVQFKLKKVDDKWIILTVENPNDLNTVLFCNLENAAKSIGLVQN